MTDGPIIDLPQSEYQRRGARLLVREKERILRATGRPSLPLCIIAVIANLALLVMFGAIYAT